MAQEQHAFIQKDRVPTAQQWQKAIYDAGYDLKINEGFEAFAHSGFLPCQLYGASSGVEVYYDLTKDVLDPDLADGLSGSRDFCISFRWGGSFQEGACAMILSFVLARSFGAILSYEGEPPCESLDVFQADIGEMLKEAERERREEE
jgi:hypothetical protein